MPKTTWTDEDWSLSIYNGHIWWVLSDQNGWRDILVFTPHGAVHISVCYDAAIEQQGTFLRLSARGRCFTRDFDKAYMKRSYLITKAKAFAREIAAQEES